MPPKPKAAAGGPANVDVTPEALAQQYKLQCEALQRQLAERTEVALAAQRQLAEVGARVKQMGADQAGVERGQLDVTAEMSRQYRAMQENLQGRVAGLEAENAAVRAELAQALREIELAKVDGVRLVRQRDEEIARLRDQMDSMAAEFGDMLAETIRKMGDKIELDVELGAESSDLLQQMEEGAAMARGK